MTQIAIVQAAPQPAPPSGPPASSNPTSFSPHLENAVAGGAKTSDDTSSNSSEQIRPNPDDPGSGSSASNLSTSIAPTDNTAALAKTTSPKWNQLSTEVDTSGNLKQLHSELSAGETKISPSLPPSLTHKSESFIKINIALTDTQGNTIQPAPLTDNDTILRQLQQIINNGNETGTVSIQGKANRASLQAGSEAAAKLGALISTQMREPQKVIEKPGLKTQTLRQDVLAQYLEAKVNTREQSNSSSNATNGDQQTGANNQQLTATSLQPNSSLSPDQSNSFQQIAALLQDVHVNSQDNSAKPMILSSGTVVYEEDVMQQLVERFQIFKQVNDTRLTLKLHPAELGELQIDLIVKEGSIKANILAQSQQIQEMVERNLPRLRNSLAEQGYTIEEILVTSQSEAVTDYNLFEQHLSHRNDYTPSTTEDNRPNGFNIVLEDAVEETTGSTTGVNIKV